MKSCIVKMITVLKSLANMCSSRGMFRLFLIISRYYGFGVPDVLQNFNDWNIVGIYSILDIAPYEKFGAMRSGGQVGYMTSLIFIVMQLKKCWPSCCNQLSQAPERTNFQSFRKKIRISSARFNTPLF